MNADRVSFVEVGKYNLDRAINLLAGIKGGVYQAIGSAVKRAGKHGATIGMKIVSEEYAIGQNELKRRTEQKYKIHKGSDGVYSVEFGYRGRVIPLRQFDVGVSRGGAVSARVLRANSRKPLPSAFIASINGHEGIYEREGPERLPIKELFGPSAVQAFYAHETTIDKMSKEVISKYEERLDHEILRILNGWGVRG